MFTNKSVNTQGSKTKVWTLQVQALTPSLFDLRPELSDHSRHLHSQPTPALGHQAAPGDPSLNYLTTFQILKNTSGLSYSPWLLDHQVFYIASPPGAPHRKHVYRWSSLNSYSKLKMLTIFLLLLSNLNWFYLNAIGTNQNISRQHSTHCI